MFATLNKLFGDLLTAHDQRRAGRVVWITTERAEPSSTTSEPALEQYLSAGGERNVRHAFSLAEAVIAGLPRPSLPPPQTWPARGLYHPEADRFFPDADALAAWQARHPHLAQQPAVAILVHRYHFINGSTAWLDEWLRLFKQQGLFAYAAFGQQVDATALSSLLETGAEEARQAHPSVLVLHQLTPQAAALQPLLERWQRPVLITQPYRQGDQQQCWQFCSGSRDQQHTWRHPLRAWCRTVAGYASPFATFADHAANPAAAAVRRPPSKLKAASLQG